MKTKTLLWRIVLPAMIALLPADGPALVGSATWLAVPGSGDWNTAGNWNSATVPNANADIATT